MNTTTTTARTMAAWLYGDAKAKPRSNDDAYGLFVERSLAMGWLSDGIRPTPTGLWGMNDATLAGEAAPREVPAASFQVVVTDAAPVPPIREFLDCVDRVLRRLIDLELTAVQLLLPPPLPGAAVGLTARPSAVALTPHEPTHASRRASIAIHIDGGPRSSVSAELTTIVDAVRSLPRERFDCSAASSSELTDGEGPPGLVDGTWGGPPRHRLTLEGVIAGWSLDRISGAAATAAYGCVVARVTTPVVLTVVPL